MSKRLFVICGLNSQISANATKAIKLKFENFATFLSFPSSAKKGRDKYKPSLSREIISTIHEFVSSKEKDCPSSITIIYAPDSSCRELISACFLFSHLICCNYSSIYNLNSVIQDISNILNTYKLPLYKKYQYLPTHNFFINYEGGVYKLFLRYFLNEITEEEVEKYFQSKTFNCENFPKFLTGKTKKKFYVDNRNLIFPPCKQGEEHGCCDKTEETLYYLSSIYRFGAFKNIGFHFDAQYSKKSLGHSKFICPKRGEIIASNETHANIYLNDAVRLG